MTSRLCGLHHFFLPITCIQLHWRLLAWFNRAYEKNRDTRWFATSGSLRKLPFFIQLKYHSLRLHNFYSLDNVERLFWNLCAQCFFNKFLLYFLFSLIFCLFPCSDFQFCCINIFVYMHNIFSCIKYLCTTVNEISLSLLFSLPSSFPPSTTRYKRRDVNIGITVSADLCTQFLP